MSLNASVLIKRAVVRQSRERIPCLRPRFFGLD